MSGGPWLERRVLCYAHQGGAKEAPSSTLWAMRHAVDAGADALELDVHATADGHLVVCHDPTVDRTTDGTGAISRMTLRQLRDLDNAYWWAPGMVVDHHLPPDGYPLRGRAPRDRRLGIATLDEVLEGFPATILNLDIKQTAPAVAPYEEALARALRAHGRSDDVIVASFHDQATEVFRTYAPDIPTSAGTVAATSCWSAAHAGEPLPELPVVALQLPTADEVMVEAAHRAGIAVHVWTIDDAEEMRRLIGLGVDGVMSDVPSVAAGVIEGLGARAPGVSRAEPA